MYKVSENFQIWIKFEATVRSVAMGCTCCTALVMLKRATKKFARCGSFIRRKNTSLLKVVLISYLLELEIDTRCI